MRAFGEVCLGAPLLKGIEEIERQCLACVSDCRNAVALEGVEDFAGVEHGLRGFDAAVVKLTRT